MWFDICCFEAQNKFVCQSKAAVQKAGCPREHKEQLADKQIIKRQ